MPLVSGIHQASRKFINSNLHQVNVLLKDKALMNYLVMKRIIFEFSIEKAECITIEHFHLSVIMSLSFSND
jgi:hypothetical protein